MSRLSASRNSSKTVYQGMVLNRTHRSEYDDSQLRDQARHSTRLDHEIRTVERARTVMAKSMEADKQLFIKSGVQNNIRVTKSRQSANNARHQALASQAATAQHHRLVSDTRVKRSSQSDTDAVDSETSAPRSSKQGQPKVTSSSTPPDHRQHKDTNNNYNNNSTTTNKSNSNSVNGSVSTTNDVNSDNRKSATTTAASKDEDPQTMPPVVQSTTDSLYDSFLDNLGDRSTSKPAHTLATPVRQLDTRSEGLTELTSPKRSTKTPERKPQLAVEGGSLKTKPSSLVERTIQTSRGDNSAGRLRTKWDNLATPKHSSPQLTKRAQIEQEFARPTARNSPGSPGTHQAKLLGTFTLTAGSSTPAPLTSAAAASATATSSLATTSTPKTKSAHSRRKQ